MKEIDFYKNKIRIESFYEGQFLKKRILFYKSNSENIEKVFTYKDDILAETQCFNQNNEIIPCR